MLAEMAVSPMPVLCTTTSFSCALLDGLFQAYDGGKVIVYELRSGYNGVSLAVQNLHDASVQVTIECKAVNALSHTGNLKATKVTK